MRNRLIRPTVYRIRCVLIGDTLLANGSGVPGRTMPVLSILSDASLITSIAILSTMPFVVV